MVTERCSAEKVSNSALMAAQPKKGIPSAATVTTLFIPKKKGKVDPLKFPDLG